MGPKPSRTPTTQSQATSRAANEVQAPHTQHQPLPPPQSPRLLTSATWPHPSTGAGLDLEHGLGTQDHRHEFTLDTVTVADQGLASYLGYVGHGWPSELASVAALLFWILHITAALGLPLIAGLSQPVVPLIIM